MSKKERYALRLASRALEVMRSELALPAVSRPLMGSTSHQLSVAAVSRAIEAIADLPQDDPATLRYMVSVDGGYAPTKEHESLEAARAEADRLAAQPNNRTARVRVLQAVATLVPVTRHQWEE